MHCGVPFAHTCKRILQTAGSDTTYGEGFEEGGYEPRTSPFSPQVEADVSQAVTAFLQGFRR